MILMPLSCFHTSFMAPAGPKLLRMTCSSLSFLPAVWKCCWQEVQERRIRVEQMKRAAEELAEVAAVHRNGLANLYCGRDPSFLWDPSRVWDLLRPVQDFEHNLLPQYRYAGREGAETLYGAIAGMEGGQHMQVLGAKGTGKSTVVCTISGYLIGSGKKRVVYISAKRFIEHPVYILKQGLLVACGGSPSFLAMTSLEELESWCLEQTRGSLLFVVDDWDELEDYGKYVLSAAMTHALVKVSSGKSRDRRIWCDSDKVDDDIRTELFDGPYTSREMDTWVAQSGLTVEQLQHVDRLTGGIPGLLRFYEETKGNEKAFEGRIRDMYTVKLFNRFIGLLTTREQLRAVLELLMYGKLSHDLAGLTDLSCFYKDKDCNYDMFSFFRPLSPYLRSQAEYYIMEQHENLQGSLLYRDILTWVQAVEVDCEEAEEGENPARMSWNVEALVIAVIRFQKRVFAFGYTFKHYRRYEHGSELAALNKLTIEELAEGVLLGPLAFNEKAVDVIYVILVGEQLHLTVIQITVAQWKAGSMKESHKLWKDEVLPKWAAAKRNYIMPQSVELFYIMPESVQLDDVSNSAPLFKKLQDVHECLEILDGLLDLKEPTTVVKGELKKCSGRTASGERCNNESRVLDKEYYCHYHHP